MFAIRSRRPVFAGLLFACAWSAVQAASFADVSNEKSGSVSVIDIVSGATKASIALGKSPEGVSASSDGRWVAVAVEEDNSVALVDGAARREVGAIAVGPDGRQVYVSNGGA